MPEAQAALCYAWLSDNRGPHSYDQAAGVFGSVKKLFPGAEVVASDAFDDFVNDVWEHRSSLPVVTAEIGDLCLLQREHVCFSSVPAFTLCPACLSR